MQGRLPTVRSSIRLSAELLGIRIRAQLRVDVLDVTLYDVFKRGPEVAVEPRVDDRIEEAVGVAQPQKETAQPLRDDVVTGGRASVGAKPVRVEKRFDDRQNEEGKPAGGEGTHDDAEGLRRFSIVGRRRQPIEAALLEETNSGAGGRRSGKDLGERKVAVSFHPGGGVDNGDDTGGGAASGSVAVQLMMIVILLVDAILTRPAVLSERRRRLGERVVAVGERRLRTRLRLRDARRDEEDTRVDDDHDGQRQVEGTDRRVELVADLL